MTGALVASNGLAPIQVSDEFWKRVDVIAALNNRAMGSLLALVRRHTGASQSRIGAAIGMSQSAVSEIICGKRSITSLDVLHRIADGLHLPSDARRRLGLAADGSGQGAAPRSDSGVDADELARVLSQSSVDDRDLDFIEQAVNLLARRYPVSGPTSIWPMTAAHLGRLHLIAARPQRLSIHRRAISLIGLTSGIAGNVWIDQGHGDRAAGYFAVGRLAGHESEDGSLTAWVLALESIAPFYSGNAHHAASLLDQASHLACRRAGRRRRAWISALRARAYAGIDNETANDALSEAYADLDRAEPPDGTDFFDKARLDGLAGTVHLLVGDTATANTLMNTALAERPSHDIKGRALLTLDLAAVRVRDDEPEAACDLITDALAMADTQLVHPIVGRAREVLSGMGRWRSTDAVRTIQEHLRSLHRQPAI
ncbi:hypothetical protein Val02_54660 [Virgisporangium aliadipatigenens]|uniref:HTH cro/C1-type domain-containing protein n=1 Tax=Virgisporangium aliadipatigenens TaxID=741659 RepID=A0A8J4DRX4_9ACTN|nr:helix-turn-helix domain-containing protein [Virgisporangium aliadipatigenens]GIJ48580.1 hypothetical protein Val02_54660 [Virgisporangium aliadipatigenens]